MLRVQIPPLPEAEAKARVAAEVERHLRDRLAQSGATELKVLPIIVEIERERGTEEAIIAQINSLRAIVSNEMVSMRKTIYHEVDSAFARFVRLIPKPEPVAPPAERTVFKARIGKLLIEFKRPA